MIAKLDVDESDSYNTRTLVNKINELIDKVNENEEDEPDTNEG